MLASASNSARRSSGTGKDKEPERTSRAHSMSDGPGATGPAMRTESSVYIVTSSGMEFMRSSGDCS